MRPLASGAQICEIGDEGKAIPEAIWRDMVEFDGYQSHELVEDLDDPGHLFVVSRWTTHK
jgi:heme-degrading monooxygenase HmoA